MSDALAPAVARLKKLLRPDAPPIPRDSFMNQAFAKEMARMIGFQEASQHLLLAHGSFGEFMYEAYCEAQAQIASAHPHCDEAVEANNEDHVDATLDVVDEALVSLLQKHTSSVPKWRSVADDLKKATGIEKTEGWCKRRAQIIAKKRGNAKSKKSWSPGVPASSNDASEAILDKLANELAFKEAARVMNEMLPGMLPGTSESKMRDASDALLSMLWSDSNCYEQSGFWQGIAIKAIHSEGETATAPLLDVYVYLQDHETSRTALQELQALVCFQEGVHLSGSVMKVADLTAVERAVELFAFGFLLSDLAFSSLTRMRNGQTPTPSCFGILEGMERSVSKVLRDEPQHFAALLVQSRLAFDNDEAKLERQRKCMVALEYNINQKWSRWKARLHEMIGLTFGSLSDFSSAAREYTCSLECGGSPNSIYLKAQCVHTIGVRARIGCPSTPTNQFDEASQLLDDYLALIADESAYDDYLFPNALYLKGAIHAHMQDFDAAQSFCAQATAAESHRCPFFGPVDTAAKRSLQRICSVVFGDVTERQAALLKFSEAYRRKDKAENDSFAKSRTVNLSDVNSDELTAKTPGNSESSGSSQIRVHILEFSRHPASLRDALLHGDDLAVCRNALAERGFYPELPCGAKIFTNPDEFNFVREAVRDRDFKPWHVVVSTDFVEAVQAAVNSLKSKDQVRQKSSTQVGVSKSSCQNCGQLQPRYACQRCRATRYCSKQCQKMDYQQHVKICPPVSSAMPVVISRTFLDIKLPTSLPSGRSVVTKSTTDADLRKGRNPRCT